MSRDFGAICLAVRNFIDSGQETSESIAQMSDEQLSSAIGEEILSGDRFAINSFANRVGRRHEKESPLRFIKNQLFGNNRVALQGRFPNAKFVWCGDHLRIYPEGLDNE